MESFTPAGADPDSILDRVLVLASDRKKIEQEKIPEFFTPVTGKWKMKGELFSLSSRRVRANIAPQICSRRLPMTRATTRDTGARMRSTALIPKRGLWWLCAQIIVSSPNTILC